LNKKKDYKETKKVLKLKENKIRLFDLLLILIVYLYLFGTFNFNLHISKKYVAVCIALKIELTNQIFGIY